LPLPIYDDSDCVEGVAASTVLLFSLAALLPVITDFCCFVAPAAPVAIPVTFILENETRLESLLQEYLAVILFSPSLMPVYLGLSVKFHFE
jgi:hypothetical protein